MTILTTYLLFLLALSNSTPSDMPDKTPSGLQTPARVMGVYSYVDLENLWIQAGGDPSIADIMAAIALAESGGRPWAFNHRDPKGDGTFQVSAGLWQISNGTMNAVSNWADPLTNAKYAVAKHKEQGFGAWGTWTSGAYLAYMGGGQIQVSGSPPSVTGNAQVLIEETPVRSTNVYSVGPYMADGSLQITFIDGRIYLYQGVDRDTVNQLLSSPSVGAFINFKMKAFPYERLE
jgi:hypothetical protein